MKQNFVGWILYKMWILPRSNKKIYLFPYSIKIYTLFVSLKTPSTQQAQSAATQSFKANFLVLTPKNQEKFPKFSEKSVLAIKCTGSLHDDFNFEPLFRSCKWIALDIVWPKNVISLAFQSIFPYLTNFRHQSCLGQAATFSSLFIFGEGR